MLSKDGLTLNALRRACARIDAKPHKPAETAGWDITSHAEGRDGTQSRSPERAYENVSPMPALQIANENVPKLQNATMIRMQSW